MLKMKFISILIFLLIFVFKSNTYPFPRVSEKLSKAQKEIPQKEELIQYVDEKGHIIETNGGIPEGYEVVSEEEFNDSVEVLDSMKVNAEEVNDVDLSSFDEQGNFIGHAPTIEQAKKQIERQNVEFREITDPQMVKEILEANGEQDYNEEVDNQEIISKDNYANQNGLSNQMNKDNNEFSKDSFVASNKIKPKSVHELYPELFDEHGNLKQGKSEKNTDLKNDFIQSKDYYQEKGYQASPTQLANLRDNNDDKVSKAFSDFDKENNINDYTLNDDHGNFSQVDDFSDEQGQVTNSSFSTESFSTETNDITTITTTSRPQPTPVQHMDIQPGIDAQSKIIIQQLFGAKAPGDIQITKQAIDNKNNSSDQGYKDTVLVPKRTSRILASSELALKWRVWPPIMGPTIAEMIVVPKTPN